MAFDKLRTALFLNQRNRHDRLRPVNLRRADKVMPLGQSVTSTGFVPTEDALFSVDLVVQDLSQVTDTTLVSLGTTDHSFLVNMDVSGAKIQWGDTDHPIRPFGALLQISPNCFPVNQRIRMDIALRLNDLDRALIVWFDGRIVASAPRLPGAVTPLQWVDNPIGIFREPGPSGVLIQSSLRYYRGEVGAFGAHR